MDDRVNTAEIFANLLEALDTDPDARRIWNQQWQTGAWPDVLTRALATAVGRAAPGLSITAKGVRDSYQRSEYLSLDLTACGPGWGPPAVIAELENSNWKVEYCAWKLLCFDAPVRILVAYVDPTGQARAYGRSADELLERVRKVTADHPGKPLDVFCGHWNRGPASPESRGRIPVDESEATAQPSPSRGYPGSAEGFPEASGEKPGQIGRAHV